MEILTDSVLPDCAVCGAKVAVEVDDSGQVVEVCQGCSLAQPPPRIPRGEAQRMVRRYWRLMGPDCRRRRCDLCTASGCEHYCHRRVS